MVGSDWERGMGVLTGKVHEADSISGHPKRNCTHMALTEIAIFLIVLLTCVGVK